MSKRNKKPCEECKRKIKVSGLIKYKGRRLCNICLGRERKKDGKLIGHVPQKIPKSATKSYWRKRPPKIKERVRGLRPIKRKKVGRPRGMGITSVEKQVLYKKYKSLGLSSLEASRKISIIVISLQVLVKKMREQEKSEDEINVRFKEKFAELCHQANVGWGNE